MSERIPTANQMYFGQLPDEPAHVEALEIVFFKSVGLPNGTWKTTSHRRLDDLNAMVQPHLPSNRPLDVMDVACSSAVSSVEWLESLQDAGIDCRMIAGDASVNAFVLSIGRNLHALVDRYGRAMQYEIGGVGLEVPLRKRKIPRYGLQVLLIKVLAKMLGPTLSDARSAARGQKWGMRWRPLQLVSPSIRRRRHIEVVEDDILVNRSYRRCFDVVRAANILNLQYFDRPTLVAMLQNLRERLRDGGRLIVCRTLHDNVNHGTVFGLDADRNLRVLGRLNDGSEIEALALSLPSVP
jgi:SAM-dependent methyltransferase